MSHNLIPVQLQSTKLGQITNLNTTFLYGVSLSISLNLKLAPVPHRNSEMANRPFYPYGGHIELIRFKEYYRMPRGHKRIPFVFPSASRDRPFPEKYTVKDGFLILN